MVKAGSEEKPKRAAGRPQAFFLHRRAAELRCLSRLTWPEVTRQIDISATTLYRHMAEIKAIAQAEGWRWPKYIAPTGRPKSSPKKQNSEAAG
jgi:hypothetical protein